MSFLAVSCKEGQVSEDLSSGPTKSILGSWKDQDQLMLLDKRDGEPFDIVAGFDLNVKGEIEASQIRHKTKVVGWMLMRVTRTFSTADHKIDARCQTSSGASKQISVTARLQLDEKVNEYSLPEQERSAYAALEGFECTAQIAGKVTRRYSISNDGNELSIILGSEPEDTVKLKRAPKSAGLNEY
ncbi:MAG: hypothetical protein RLZZ488_1035 [Pseudomonadota bacterium]|jgi:hypothetical protein